MLIYLSFFFFFTDTATTEIYTFPYTTLFRSGSDFRVTFHLAASLQKRFRFRMSHAPSRVFRPSQDRKSTRLNSSHLGISYAVFCLKKKKKTQNTHDARMKVEQDRTEQPNRTT